MEFLRLSGGEAATQDDKSQILGITLTFTPRVFTVFTVAELMRCHATPIRGERSK